MANLVIPNSSQHQYVVGIDFGHGETSAAICPIEWEKEASKRESNVQDIDIDRAARKKVITSAICRTEIKGLTIGDEAFEHTTDNNGIRISFKQKPKSLDGESERLMMDFMRVVYSRIRENCEELTDSNHVVYIARPSGWIEEDAKELYRQMALDAGIPLAGLTSESRAAIFYAKNPKINFANRISKGAIVFDLGSSTLDLTYLSDEEKPIDYGYDLGASIIDNVIYECMILSNPDIKEFVKKYPQYIDALKFKARKFKEEAYSRSEDSKTIGGFPLGNIIPDEEPSYDEYADTYIKLRINNLAELNKIIDDKAQYTQRLREALSDFKHNKIPKRSINGVFLTGGASRMNFIIQTITESLEIDSEDIKIDGDNPSLTISRGIAMLGTMDATTYNLREELKKSISSYFKDNNLMEKLIEKITNKISDCTWIEIEHACDYWVNYGSTTELNELQRIVDSRINSFQLRIPTILNELLTEFLTEGTVDIRKRMNKIISQYEPGMEITYSKSIELSEASQLAKGLVDNPKVIDLETYSFIIGKIVYIIIVASVARLFLGGVVDFIVHRLWPAERIRRMKVDKVIDRKYQIIPEIRDKTKRGLKDNQQFNTSVMKTIEEYFDEVIKNNLEQVIIPIE